MLLSITGGDFAADELTTLEAHLAGTLKPVTPSKALYTGMRNRLHMPEVHLNYSRLNDWRSLVTIFGGVMSAALVLITVTRALFFFYRRARAG